MARAVQTRTIDVQRRILDAAVEVMLEHGYSGASTVRIQSAPASPADASCTTSRRATRC